MNTHLSSAAGRDGSHEENKQEVLAPMQSLQRLHINKTCCDTILDIGQATYPVFVAYPCRCEAAVRRLQARVAIALRYTYRLILKLTAVGLNVRTSMGSPLQSNHHALT